MSYYERRLPHWHPDGSDLFLTWRLSGSLPMEVVRKLRTSKTKLPGVRFREFDLELDRVSSGPAWLKEPAIASLVVAQIESVAAKELCQLYAWVVMPNHVHLLIAPKVPLPLLTKTIKGPTARYANLLLSRTGAFWQDESFDHWIRNGAEFEKVRQYIEQNPVRAGLVGDSARWPWSSAVHGSVMVSKKAAQTEVRATESCGT